jgi:gamma-glutamylcyclotransferase (GGCT)/AIG2-like uncharacterized protein YtfP
MEVFVYGTLTDPAQAGTVLDSFEYAGGARLEGCRRVEGTYPTLAPGGSVDGRVLRTEEIDALDQYEGVDRSLYVRVPVPVADADGTPDSASTVAIYVGDPAALDAPADWPGEGPFRERVRRGLDSHDVRVVFK